MKKIPVDKVYQMAEKLEAARLACFRSAEQSKKEPLTPEMRESLLQAFLAPELDSQQIRFVFKFTHLLFGEFVDRLKNKTDNIFVEDVGLVVAKISERLRHELSLKSVYEIAENRLAYYDNAPAMFGENVAKAFPSSLFDIEEAGRCLAVGRSTACVFHLMRVFSPLIKAIALEFSFTPNENWGSFLNDFRDAVWRKYPNDKTAVNEEQRVFYSDLEQQLRAIKDAWRNPTMHSIAAVYTEEKAEEIFGYVKGLMKKAAEKLKEKP